MLGNLDQTLLQPALSAPVPTTAPTTTTSPPTAFPSSSSSSSSKELRSSIPTAGKENDLAASTMAWNPQSFASAEYDAYSDSYPKSSYPDAAPAIWRKAPSPYLQDAVQTKNVYERARQSTYPGDFKDAHHHQHHSHHHHHHQTPPRHYNPPTPAQSPYGGMIAAYESTVVSDGAGGALSGSSSSFQGSPDRAELLALVNRLHTPPLSPHARERALRSQLLHYDANIGVPPLGADDRSVSGYVDGPIDAYQELRRPSALGLPFEDAAAPDQTRFGHSRNIVLDNLPVHISLGELKNILQSFGDVRYMFRPKQGLYSGVIVMFFDIEHALSAYRSLSSMNLGNRRCVTYFVDPDQLHALLGADAAAGDPFISELIDNQGEVLVSGLVHRDDAAILRILEAYGKVNFLRSFTYGNHVSYAAEYLDTRAARQAFDSLHGFVFHEAPIHVAFPKALSGGLNGPMPHVGAPSRFRRDTVPANNGRIRTRAMSSSPVSNIDLANYVHAGEDGSAGMHGYQNRSWQPIKHRALKIDTTSPAPPSPLRRAASANCVTVSLARELEGSMYSEPQTGGPRTALPLGRSNSTKQLSAAASLNKYAKGVGIGSMSYENLNSAQPIPPPNEHAIPAANELNLYKIAMGYDTRTTFMIRNIPNKYTQQMLIAFLNRTHKGQFDFLYLRMDFKNRCNVGYAFINFTGSAAILSFAERVVGKKWSKFNSDKVCTLSYANIQGKNALIQKFRNSSVMLEAQDWRPKIFYTEGPNAGEEEVFPFPTMAIRPRSDVLFSRDNAGQPHRIAGSELPSVNNNNNNNPNYNNNNINNNNNLTGQSSPRRQSSRDPADYPNQPWNGREDAGDPLSNRDSDDQLLDGLDLSKLSLNDAPIPLKENVGSVNDGFQSWDDNNGSVGGTAAAAAANRFTTDFQSDVATVTGAAAWPKP
ncbi:hypothetical protein HDU86_004644 [Geranomyces michiganensis]|nr:hypothetical protein HDU86_004644 [Geranomyces michiganensis]